MLLPYQLPLSLACPHFSFKSMTKIQGYFYSSTFYNRYKTHKIFIKCDVLDFYLLIIQQYDKCQLFNKICPNII